MFWNVLKLSEDVQGSQGMFWDVLERSWDVQGYFRMFRDVFGCSGMFWNVLECPGDVQGYFRMFGNVLRWNVFWNVLAHSELFWCSMMLLDTTRCSVMFPDVLAICLDILKMFYNVLRWSGMLCDAMECFTMIWNVLECSSMFRNVTWASLSLCEPCVNVAYCALYLCIRRGQTIAKSYEFLKKELEHLNSQSIFKSLFLWW